MDLSRYRLFAAVLGLILLISASAFAGDDEADEEEVSPFWINDEWVDEPVFENLPQHRVQSQHGIVAADHRYASEAAAEALEAGGSAADAGVVGLLVGGIANPFASGLGGGGFCLYREAAKEKTTVLDFRETAPRQAHRDMYIADGEPQRQLARRGGLAVATPGEPAGLWALHGRFGELEWEQVVEPARRFAELGFPVTETLADILQDHAEELEKRPKLAAIFQDEEGRFLTENKLLVRDDLVNALTLLRDEGVRPFYVGPIADAIAATTQRHYGVLSTDDLAAYRVIPREPTVGHFMDHQIHSMPPPSSGGIALAQAFNILHHVELSDDPNDVASLHAMLEALKHAFADRAHWLGDSDFVDVPVQKLTSQEYAAQLAARIDPEGVLDIDAYGTTAPDFGEGGTAHLSVVDSDENMLACTSTINTRFGSMVYVPDFGLILNNEMADFTIKPGTPNIFGLVGNEQNAVAPGKRPLSSMSPTLVLDGDGQPVMTLGASGGPMIISGVYFAILHSLLYDADPLDAITAARLHHQWIPDTLIIEYDDIPAADRLRQLGHDLMSRPAHNAVQLIRKHDGRWIGVSDPRKGGIPAAATPSTDSE